MKIHVCACAIDRVQWRLCCLGSIPDLTCPSFKALATDTCLQTRGLAVSAQRKGIPDLHTWTPVFASACAACILTASPALSAMRDKLPPPSNDPGRCRYVMLKWLAAILSPNVRGLPTVPVPLPFSTDVAAWRRWTSLQRHEQFSRKRPALGWTRPL